MKTIFTAAMALTAALTVAQGRERAEPVFASSPKGSYATGARFDAAKVVTFKGRVVGVEISTPAHSEVPNVSLLVKLTNGGTALVELGPKPYVDQQRMNVRLKDQVTVTGSKVFEGENSAVLASEVNHNGFRVAFRSPEGRPFWARRGR